MLELFRSPNYDFISKRKWAYLASALFIVIGLISLFVHGGLRDDIDFAGGTLVQVRFERAPDHRPHPGGARHGSGSATASSRSSATRGSSSSA